jgi:MFS family permease
LQHPDFRRLWISQLVSQVGSQMQVLALNWHVYLLTRSPLALGLVGLTRVVPVVLFSLAGGVVADRRDRRRLMLATQAVMTLVSLALAVLALGRHESVWFLYALNAVHAAASAFDNPARQALLPRLVPLEDLPGALALHLTMFHAAMIGGPALAGTLIGGAFLGGWSQSQRLGLLYALNAASFLGVLATLATLKTSGAPEAAPPEGREPVLESLRAGLRFVFRTPIMVSTMTLDFFATFFSGALSLLPIVADQVLHVGPSGYGWLLSAPAAGAVLGSLYTTLRPLPRRQGRALLIAVAIYGLATVSYGLSRTFWITLVALGVGGLADLISTVIRQTIRQLLTPDALRGRMTSINMIFFMGGPQLGELEAGLVASLFASAALGVTVSVVSGGLLTVAAAAWVAVWAPHVGDYQAPGSVSYSAS